MGQLRPERPEAAIAHDRGGAEVLELGRVAARSGHQMDELLRARQIAVVIGTDVRDEIGRVH